MFNLFYLIKDLFLINPKLILKPLIFSVIGLACAWHFVLKKPLYQRIYGKPDATHLEIAEADHFIDMPKQPIIPLNVNGYDIEVQAIKAFSTTTKIVYIDRYSSLGSWYRSREGDALYDSVVPQDLSFATGMSGKNTSCFKFAHEYRLLEYSWNSCPQNITQNANIDISNNHTIAYSRNVQKGLDILKVGDIAHIEGYLMYWNGTGNLKYQRFESAITPDQMSDQLAGGQKSGLCRQLLLTKLTFDGYTFE